MKRTSNLKLRLAKETVRNLLSEELQRVAAGGPVGTSCPSNTGCSSSPWKSANECGSDFCSLPQY